MDALLWGRTQLAETSLQHGIRTLKAEGILEIMEDYHLTDNPHETKTKPGIQDRDEWLVLFVKESGFLNIQAGFYYPLGGFEVPPGSSAIKWETVKHNDMIFLCNLHVSFMAVLNDHSLFSTV